MNTLGVEIEIEATKYLLDTYSVVELYMGFSRLS